MPYRSLSCRSTSTASRLLSRRSRSWRRRWRCSRAARSSYSESNGDDVKRRLMVVPNCHVTKLLTVSGRVVSLETGQGSISVPPGGIVVLAAGTIESTRLALASFPDPDTTIGRNLMVHLRSNLTIRIPRDSFPELNPDGQVRAQVHHQIEPDHPDSARLVPRAVGARSGGGGIRM